MRGRSAAFWTIVRKDIQEHVRRRHLHLGVALCLVLFLITAVVRTHDIRNAAEERSIFFQRWLPAVREQVQRDESIQVENTRSISPLSILSVGLEPIIPFRFSSTKEGLRFGAVREAHSTADALFGYLDATFVVSTLLSLVAVAFTFDSVSGERVQGTLPLLLSYPISWNAFIAAKVAANAIVLLFCFLPAYVLMVAYAAVAGVPMVNPWHWVAYGALSVLYLVTFALLGVASSTHSGTPADSAIRAVMLWALFIFVIPRTVSLLITFLLPSSSAARFAVQEDESVSQLRVQHAASMQKVFEEYVTGGGDQATRAEKFQRSRQDAIDDLREKRRAIVNRLWDEQQRREQLRQNWTHALSLLSPASAFMRSASELSWTGETQRAHFVAEARAYDDKIGRRLAESREAFYARTADGRATALVAFDDIRPYLIPFSPTRVRSTQMLPWIAADALTLLVYIALFAAYAVAAARNMDVRF